MNRGRGLHNLLLNLPSFTAAAMFVVDLFVLGYLKRVFIMDIITNEVSILLPGHW